MTNKDMPDLKPCPFCGEARISFNHPDPNEGYEGSINCPACMATIPREVNDDEELISCWNTRADLCKCQKLPDIEKDPLGHHLLAIKNLGYDPQVLINIKENNKCPDCGSEMIETCSGLVSLGDDDGGCRWEEMQEIYPIHKDPETVFMHKSVAEKIAQPTIQNSDNYPDTAMSLYGEPADAQERGTISAPDAQEDEIYKIGKRDGYEEAVQEIDIMTGGDGEYVWSDDPERSCPDPESMKKKIEDRFVAKDQALRSALEALKIYANMDLKTNAVDCGSIARKTIAQIEALINPEERK